jgi:hypothetical protein
MIPELSFFFEKYIVFAAPSEPFGDFDEPWYKERSNRVDVIKIRGTTQSSYF